MLVWRLHACTFVYPYLFACRMCLFLSVLLLLLLLLLLLGSVRRSRFLALLVFAARRRRRRIRRRGRGGGRRRSNSSRCLALLLMLLHHNRRALDLHFLVARVVRVVIVVFLCLDLEIVFWINVFYVIYDVSRESHSKSSFLPSSSSSSSSSSVWGVCFVICV